MASVSSNPEDTGSRNFPTTVAICVFLAIAAFFLWEEHRAHLLGIVPYLLLAACPLMHLLMHGRHGHHHRSHSAHHDEGGRS